MSSTEKSESKEKLALEKFKAITEDTKLDDTTLLRFLRARSLDCKKANEQLRKTLQWRKDDEIDTIHLWNAPSEIKDDMVTYFTGFDYGNRPVFFSQIGIWDIRPVLAKGMKDDCLRYAAKSIELVLEVAKKMDNHQFITILDIEGATLARAMHWGTIEFMIRLFHDFEAYYPETLYEAYILNVPAIFWYAYNLIKPLFSGHTLSKIHIFDSDKNKWTQELQKNIPADSLTVACGGTVVKGIPVLEHKEFLEKCNYNRDIVASKLMSNVE